MEIWRTTRLAPGTSYMKARIVSLMFCFYITSPENSCFVVDLLCLFCCAYELLCFWMPREGIEFFTINSRLMQFVETKKRSSRSPLELKSVYVRVHSHGIARNKYYVRCNNQANELKLPRRWNQWKNWVKWQQLCAKCDRLQIFWDLRTRN